MHNYISRLLWSIEDKKCKVTGHEIASCRLGSLLSLFRCECKDMKWDIRPIPIKDFWNPWFFNQSEESTHYFIGN